MTTKIFPSTVHGKLVNTEMFHIERKYDLFIKPEHTDLYVWFPIEVKQAHMLLLAQTIASTSKKCPEIENECTLGRTHFKVHSYNTPRVNLEMFVVGIIS